jgi:hypothetical protein
MTDHPVVVFQPKPRYTLKPAVLAAVMTTAAIVAGLWRSSPHSSWQGRVTVLLATFASFVVWYWGTRLLFARRHRVTVLPSGLKGPTTEGHQAFCGWENITEAQVIRGGPLEYVLVKGRYLAFPLRLPLEFLDDHEFVAAIDRHIEEGTPLSLALRSAGA